MHEQCSQWTGDTRGDHPGESLLNDVKMLVAQGEYDAAFDFYEMFLVNYPNDAFLLRDYGLARYVVADHDEALTLLNRALSMVPQDKIALLARGELYAIGYGPTGDFAEAIPIFQQVLLLSPHDTIAQLISSVQIGIIIKDAEKKIGAYNAAIKLDNQCLEAHWNLAVALWAQAKFHEAEREWTIAERICTDNHKSTDTIQKYLEIVQQHKLFTHIITCVLSVLQPWLSNLI